MSGLGVDAVLDLIILWRGWIVAGLHVVVAGLVSVHYVIASYLGAEAMG